MNQVSVDDALFRELEANGEPERLRFWESRQTLVVVGALGNINCQVHEDACRADGVPILRRTTGGGAVVVGRGCLSYSLLLSLDARPELRPVGDSYRLILSRIVAALDFPGLRLQGLGDIAITNRKVAGSAQRRGRRALLHHGTILYQFEIAAMERYLKMPKRQPSYRANRSHSDFVTNIPLPRDVIVERLVDAWSLERAAV
ncbi:MAG: lipoate--protein ligase family protein [Acidobacteria bacterium]|nr:lipoate--protein ligase family protein [Acidobacteriota bacterium]